MAGQQQWCFVRQAEWLLVRVCGFLSPVVGGSSAIPVHSTELSSKQLVMLRWDSSSVMFIIYVKFAEKQACFLENFYSNSCCGRFQISFLNRSSNLIMCNNSVWMVFQPNFYLLCVVCFQRLQAGKVRKFQFMSAMRGKANNVHPVFPSSAYHFDIPRMRIVTI